MRCFYESSDYESFIRNVFSLECDSDTFGAIAGCVAEEFYVWIGANVTILPGVTIGDDTVIGAGSVVNRDIPSGVIAVGNPCRAIRKITEADKEKYPIYRG